LLTFSCEPVETVKHNSTSPGNLISFPVISVNVISNAVSDTTNGP